MIVWRKDQMKMELENLHSILQACLRKMGWRLRRPSVHRMTLDIATLCTGLRVVVMVDYAWGAHPLQKQLSSLLELLAKELSIVLPLKVMSIDDIGYLIHEKNLHLYMEETLSRAIGISFVVLDDALARFALPEEEEGTLSQFACFRDFFLHMSSLSTRGVIDMGSFLAACEIALPTLNGWVLGYPIIYLFKKEKISGALRMLSASSLHRYELRAQSEILPPVQGELVMDEITSFTLPTELSLQGANEEWAQAFLSLVKSQAEGSQIWKSLSLEVTLQVCQSVVL